MLKRLLPIIALGAVGFGAILSVNNAAPAAPAFETQTSDAAGVHVAVTPKITRGATQWDFEITMDTHIKPLAEDLVQGSVLVFDNDRRIKPPAWQGDAPGGHHRRGVLSFSVPTEAPKTFELQIDSIGGVVRVFRWEVR